MEVANEAAGEVALVVQALNLWAEEPAEQRGEGREQRVQRKVHLHPRNSNWGNWHRGEQDWKSPLVHMGKKGKAGYNCLSAANE